MARDKTELLRDRYPLDEAAELTGYKREDLIHLAAKRDLQIYVIAENWTVDRVYEIDHSTGVSENHYAAAYQGPDPGDFPDFTGEDGEKILADWTRKTESRDRVVGNHIQYARLGPFRTYYDQPTTGIQPVAAFCFSNYEDGPDGATIELDLNQMIKASDAAVHERFIRPAIAVLMKDALGQGKLVILKSEIIRLRTGQSVAETKTAPSTEAETSTAQVHKKSKNDEMHSFWQKMAEEMKNSNPSLTQNAISERMEPKLKKDNPPYARAAKTITKFIKV